MDIEQVVRELVDLGMEKGRDRSGDYQSAYALGYCTSALRRAISTLSARQQKLVIEDLMRSIEWGKTN